MVGYLRFLITHRFTRILVIYLQNPYIIMLVCFFCLRFGVIFNSTIPTGFVKNPKFTSRGSQLVVNTEKLIKQRKPFPERKKSISQPILTEQPAIKQNAGNYAEASSRCKSICAVNIQRTDWRLARVQRSAQHPLTFKYEIRRDQINTIM